MSDTGIAVIESTWWKKKNTSVRGFFEIIADIVVKNPHGYHYEMANNVEGLKKAIETLSSTRDVRYLYLAMHGNAGGVVVHNRETLSAIMLRNILSKANQQRNSLKGLYLGCCDFATLTTASKLFERDISPTWIAGYSTSVDWIESSVLDMLFLSTLVNPLLDRRTKRRIRETELQRVCRVAGQIKVAAPGLVRDLGFGVFVRDPEFGVRDLLAENDLDELYDAA
ncbi:hypothetical protein AMC83_PA00002 (plasmid) [Rhizobium phaseoli]|uniref:hypothetical protein n=1 Tax=Rhizobium phaseoli TaxID=396 RepID=UPI0007F0BD3B|nr:hypothetical protein [Rhizobium phaseoli]ANL74229.1 hypothetical protein AMC83_PA00002 [Rhizobium phaseoli]